MCLILLSLINFCSIKEKFTRFIWQEPVWLSRLSD
jgi:hypothetical protein